MVPHVHGAAYIRWLCGVDTVDAFGLWPIEVPGSKHVSVVQGHLASLTVMNLGPCRPIDFVGCVDTDVHITCIEACLYLMSNLLDWLCESQLN